MYEQDFEQEVFYSYRIYKGFFIGYDQITTISSLTFKKGGIEVVPQEQDLGVIEYTSYSIYIHILISAIYVYNNVYSFMLH